MRTIEEINARISAIVSECESATGDALTSLNTEMDTLVAERTQIENEARIRQQMRSNVASGATGTVIPGMGAQNGNANQRGENTEEAEERAFADFLRTGVNQMRTNEQNIDLTNGAVLLPTSIGKRVISAVKDRCPILSGCDLYHVKGTLKIPVYGPKTVEGTAHDITVAYATEFSELTADSGAFTSVDLTGYLVGALTLIGKSVINSADIDIVSFVVDKMADKIAGFIEGELLKGTENKCTGALSTTNNLNAESTSAISADKLIELQACVKQAYQQNACWTMNPATFTAIKKLKDGNGKYLVCDDFSGAFPYRLLGKPVYLSDNMPTITSAAKAVLYGDYKGLAVNMRENVSIEVLREKYATMHAVGVCAFLEMDSKVENSQMLATLTMSVTG